MKRYRVTFKNSKNEFYCEANKLKEDRHMKRILWIDDNFTVFDWEIDKIEVVEEESVDEIYKAYAESMAEDEKAELDQVERAFSQEEELEKTESSTISREEFDSFKDIMEKSATVTVELNKSVLEVLLEITKIVTNKHYKKDL